MTAVCDEFRPAAGGAHRWCDACGWRRDLHDPGSWCHLCREPFDPDTAHTLHDEDCTRSSGVCRCGLRVCPGCCPDCNEKEEA